MKTCKPILLIYLFLFVFLISCETTSTNTPSGSQSDREKISRDLRKVGVAYMHEGQYTRALKELLDAEKYYADDPILQDYIGIAYKKKKRYDSAILHFNKAIELQPDYAPARNNLGTTYMEQKNWDAAIATLKDLTDHKSFELYGTPQKPLFNIGLCYFQKKDFAIAEEYFNRSLQYYIDGFSRDEFNLVIYSYLGRIYIEMGEFFKAIEILNEGLTAKPDTPLLLFYLGEAFRLANEKDEAIRVYKRVMTIAPSNQLGKRAKERLSEMARGN